MGDEIQSETRDALYWISADIHHADVFQLTLAVFPSYHREHQVFLEVELTVLCLLLL